MLPDENYFQNPFLSEVQRGIGHHMTKKEIQDEIPIEILRRQIDGDYHHRPTGGENWLDVHVRISTFLDFLFRELNAFLHNVFLRILSLFCVDRLLY